MLFNSAPFLIFFLVFIILYYMCAQHVRIQNILILLGSLYFYSCWSIRFLFLMLFASTSDYFFAKFIYRTKSAHKRKAYLTIALTINLTILFIFKYYNFFVSEFMHFFGRFGLLLHPQLLHVVLPIGISFYTFQTMAYTIDVYRREVPAEPDFINYTCFVTFFPHMIAGPILKASNLLPQIRNPRKFTWIDLRDGFWLIIWGFFLKVVIADSAAPFVDYAFLAQQSNGVMTVLGTVLFGLQIYCDFFGYSLIALAIGKMLGIQLSWNFNLPYFATTIQEFWRRWHITLSNWFRDNVYIPLGGNRGPYWKVALNVFIVMSLVGLWHGASWNFVLWGMLHGSALLVYKGFDLWQSSRSQMRWRAIGGFLLTQLVVFTGWFIFRFGDAFSVQNVAHHFLNFYWDYKTTHVLMALIVLGLPVFLIDWCNYKANDQMYFSKTGRTFFPAITGTMLFLVIVFFQTKSKDFIYFQF